MEKEQIIRLTLRIVDYGIGTDHRELSVVDHGIGTVYRANTKRSGPWNRSRL